MLDGCTFGWKAAPLFGCLVVNPNMLRLLRTLGASRCARMKSRDIASSATRSEPSQCRVLPVDAKSSHRASSALENESSTVCTSIEGRIHHVRGTARVTCRLAKLLRHHRLG